MKPKIIILHGLNNTIEAFFPLRDSLQSLGHECVLLRLPGHHQHRNESITFESSQREFDQTISPHTQRPYIVVAFSLGALYLQLWLEKNKNTPLALQVLLAPALKIRHQDIAQQIIGRLWHALPLPSQTPPNLRLFPFLYIRDYSPLLEGLQMFKELKNPFKIPTLILIDPQDEVIDVQGLKQQVQQHHQHVDYELIDRKYLKGQRLGKHHVLFHPDYFGPGDWQIFIGKIKEFFEKN